jgi:hypoxanthine phosphoribosyltransferase
MLTKQLLADEKQVDDAIDLIAAKITKDLAGKQPLFVALLRGAAPFASKLMFAIQHHNPAFHPELDYMMVSTYGDGHTPGKPRIVTDLSSSTVVEGRIVVILDDVLDKGVTAHFVKSHLMLRGAESVKLAVLADKKTVRIDPIEPDYCGLELDDFWLVGMGMDDAQTAKEHGRWQGRIEAKLEL